MNLEFISLTLIFVTFCLNTTNVIIWQLEGCALLDLLLLFWFQIGALTLIFKWIINSGELKEHLKIAVEKNALADRKIEKRNTKSGIYVQSIFCLIKAVSLEKLRTILYHSDRCLSSMTQCKVKPFADF